MATCEWERNCIAYRAEGGGPALVLVHGTGGCGESTWGPLTALLSSRWTVVRPDFSGSGNTVDDGAPLSVEKLAAQVVAVARAALASPFCLVGFSLGAAVAAHIAATYHDEVRGLVLLAGYASCKDARMQLQFEMWRKLIRHDRRAMAELVLVHGLSPSCLSGWSPQRITQTLDDIVTNTRWEGMDRQLALNLKLDIREALERITQPTLVLACRQDQMVPPSHALSLAHAIPGARYAELDCGHLAPLEQTEALAHQINAFLPHSVAPAHRSTPSESLSQKWP